MADKETYTFDVEASITGAYNAINELKKLIEDVNATAAKAAKSAGVVSENAILEQKKRYQELTKEVEKYAQAYNKATSPNSKTNASAGDIRQLRALIDELKQSKENSQGVIRPSLIGQAAAGINENSQRMSNNNSAYGQWHTANYRSNPNFARDRDNLSQYREMSSAIKTLLRQQGAISTRATARNHLTDADNRQFKANNASFSSSYDSQMSELQDRLGVHSEQLDDAKRKAQSLKNANDPISLDELNETKDKIKYLQQEKDATQGLIEELNRAQKKMGSINSDMSSAQSQSGFKVDPTRGSAQYWLQNRAYSIGQNVTNSVVGGIKGRYNQGRQIYDQYGVDAMNVGQLQSDESASDSAVLKRVQTMGARNGYKTQDSLAYYQMAMSRSGNSQAAGFGNESDKITNAYMSESRASGLGEAQYKNLMTAVAGANGVTKSSDVSKIVNAMLASNAMSGQSGNYTQNAQNITSLISAISSSRNMTASQIKTTAANESAISSIGKSWQGTSGANGIASLNSSIQAAGKGQNAGLQYIIQSEQGLGGIQGMMQARRQADLGLGSTQTISDLRKHFSNMDPDYAAQSLQSLDPDLSATKATDFIKALQSGKLSDAQLAKKYNDADKKGSSKANSNKENYDSSLTGTIKQVDSKIEKNSTALTKATGAIEKLRLVMEANVATSLIGSAGGSLLETGGKAFANSKIADTVSGVGENLGKSGAEGAAEGAAKGAAKGASKTTDAMGGAAEGAAKAGSKGLFGKVGSAAEDVANSGKFGSKAMGALGKAGKIAAPIAVMESVADIATSKDKVRAVGRNAGGWGGAWAGAQAGATIGSLGGPVGILIGGAVGGIAGGIAGSDLGDKVGKATSDDFKKKNKDPKKLTKKRNAGGVDTATKSFSEKLMNGEDTGKVKGGPTKYKYKGDPMDFVREDDDDKKKKTRRSSAKRVSRKSDQGGSGYLSYREQNELLAKDAQVTAQREKFVKDYGKLLTKEANNNSKSNSTKSSSSSKRAFGGLVSGETTIAEGNKPEMVTPLDPSKRNRTQDTVNQIAKLSGVRANDIDNSGTRVVNQGAFSPSVTINVNGNADNDTANAIAEKVKTALKNATDNYRTNTSRTW